MSVNWLDECHERWGCNARGWHLHGGTWRYALTGQSHEAIRESTTGNVFCGDSWCDGSCGLPALVLHVGTGIFKAHGRMVANGPVWQAFRVKWNGSVVEVTPGDTSLETVKKRHWQ